MYEQCAYDLAYCYYQNKEYMRCINLVESLGLTFVHDKFRILLSEANIQSHQI